MNQTKNDFLNNIEMTLKTHMILPYTPAQWTLPIVFHPKWVVAVSLQKYEIYFNQTKWLIWAHPCWFAS